MAAAKKIRVGIVGCGKIADVSYVPAFKKMRGVAIAALCDVDRKKMTSMRKRHGLDAEMFADFKALLRADLDAVCLCTPNNLHYGMTLAAFKAGLHVLCEKPMAATLPEATRMIAAGKRTRKVLHINQSVRYSALYRTVVDLVDAGRIGEPMHVRCIRAAANTPNFGWSPGATWFVQKKAQGGLVLDIGIHMADLMRQIVGEVESIGALVDTRKKGIDVPDNVSAVFRFKNGGTGILELSWTTPTGANVFEVYGTKGTIRMGFGAQPIELITVRGKKRTVSYPAEKKNQVDSFQTFVAAVRGKAKTVTPGEYGRRALALCDAIMESSRTGRFVKVKRFAGGRG